MTVFNIKDITMTAVKKDIDKVFHQQELFKKALSEALDTLLKSVRIDKYSDMMYEGIRFSTGDVFYVQNNIRVWGLDTDEDERVFFHEAKMMPVYPNRLKYLAIEVNQEINNSNDYTLFVLTDNNGDLYYAGYDDMPVAELYNLYMILTQHPNTFVIPF